MGNADDAAAPAGLCAAPAASPAGLGALTEMICVYSLGPLGAASGAGATGSLAMRANAPVAPSEGRPDAAGLKGVGFGNVGAATFAAALTGPKGSFIGTGTGTGAGKTGAGKTGTEKTGAGGFGVENTGAEGFGAEGPGAGKPAAGSTAARGSPDDGGVVVLDIREDSALNHPVNEPAGSLPAIPGAGGGSAGCGFAEPNTEVKSPTVFCGASCRGVTVGTSDGVSPRNGP